MVLGNHGRGLTLALFGPLARLLNRLGVSPNVVTVVGGVLVSGTAFWLLPTGHLIAGSLTVGILVFADSIDGIMARLGGKVSRFGAFLDSVVDRFSDGALFGALLLFFMQQTTGVLRVVGIVGALGTLILGQIVPYARAKGEVLQVDMNVGLAERADRLVIALVATLFVGLGMSVWVLAIALLVLTVASFITVVQRVVVVHRALTATEVH